jgi:hypothetical protein
MRLRLRLLPMSASGDASGVSLGCERATGAKGAVRNR